MEKNAYNHSICLLSKKDYSKFKLKQKLLQKEFSELEIDQAINQLINKRYLKENEYIESRIKKLHNNGYSSYYIVNKLQQEDIHLEADQIQTILINYNLSEKDQLNNLIEKKVRQLLPIFSEKDSLNIKHKVIRFLQSKGFQYSDYNSVIDESLEELL